jgi:hypothetical protein
MKFYIALLAAVPVANASLHELAGGGYARAEIDSDDLVAAPHKKMTNTKTTTFPLATHGWEPIFGYAILDQPKGGDVLDKGPIYPAGTKVNRDDRVVFHRRALDINHITVPIEK